MKHYQQRDKESIEIIHDALSPDEFRGFLLGNVYKYLNRFQYKGQQAQDIAKAIHYMQALEVLMYNPDCTNPFDELRQKDLEYYSTAT